MCEVGEDATVSGDSHYSPAALALARIGGRQRELAEYLGVGIAAVSNYFNGYRAAPPKLFSAIEHLYGREVADEIAGLLGTAR